MRSIKGEREITIDTNQQSSPDHQPESGGMLIAGRDLNLNDLRYLYQQGTISWEDYLDAADDYEETKRPIRVRGRTPSGSFKNEPTEASHLKMRLEGDKLTVYDPYDPIGFAFKKAFKGVTRGAHDAVERRSR